MTAPLRVPLIDLPRQHAPIRDEILAAMARVLDSGRFILGDEVEALEREMATISGAPEGCAVGVSSGTDALLVALMALGVGPGDEVVTTALSFFATAGAIARVGATPVFADVGQDFNLDPVDARKRYTSRTRAVIPVDLFGRRARIAELAVPDGVFVVEDAAQAAGVRPAWGAAGGEAGGRVDALALSFFPSKNLGALGDAGMVVLRGAALAERVRLLRGHGARPKYRHLVVGGNFRLDALQAAVLRVKLAHLPEWNAARRTNALAYRAALADLHARGALLLPDDAEGHLWHHFVVRVPGVASDGQSRRDALRRALGARGIETEIYYPEPLHLQPCFAALEYKKGDLPGAEAAAREALAIPVHAELDERQRGFVVESLVELCR